jgi:O-antigen ligase
MLRRVRPEFLIPIAIGLIALAAISAPTLVIFALLLIFVPWAISYTSHNVMWLLLPLLLMEAVTGSKLLTDGNESISAMIRYPLVLIFCAPIVPLVWRSGILQKGGFRSYMLYVLWALITVSYSIRPVMSLGRVLSTALPILAMCAIVSEIKNGDDARRAMGIFLLGCGIITAINLFVLVATPGDAYGLDIETGMERFEGTFSQPNQVGALMLGTIGSAVCYWPLAKGWTRYLTIAAVIGSLIIGAAADSRSPFIGLAVGLALYVVWKFGLKGAIALPALVVAVFLTLMVIPHGTEYLNRGDVTTATGRDVAWQFAIRSIKDRPIMGYGYEIEGEIFQSRYFTAWDDIWDQGIRSPIHNGFLSRAVGLGVPMTLFWLFFMWRPVLSCFRRNYDPWSLRSIALLAFVPVMILNLTETISDCRAIIGILMVLSWAMLEKQRLLAVEMEAVRDLAVLESTTPLVRALQSSAA